MTHFLLLLVLAGLSLQAAADLVFGDRIPVTGGPTAGVFHHLDSAGRRNIALSDDRIAVVWEDNHSGAPGIYLASKTRAGTTFSVPVRISTAAEAYEPAVAGVGGGRFVVVWEEDGSVFARSVVDQLPTPVLRLSAGAAAGHATVSSRGDRVFAAWREERDHYPAIFFTRLRVDDAGGLRADTPTVVDPQPTVAPQLYPSLAVSGGGIAVAWEDRRAGHTRLLYSYSKDGKEFTTPEHLNEFYSNRNEYDRGNGVTRVSLAVFGADEILAAWMDKRRNNRGYSIYSALGSDGGQSYGPNERVQSDHGDELPHFNPAAAGNGEGMFLVAWDDYRSGTSDIWLSSYDDDLNWGMDWTPGPASGPGEQSNPTAAIDEDGTVHLAWVEYPKMGEPTMIWYSSGVRDGD